MITANNISFKADDKVLLQPMSSEFRTGSFTVIMGPNGAGKSTLLKILSGALKPASGKVELNIREIGSIKTNDLAKQRAVLSQHYHLNFPLEVKEIVTMGRYPYFDMKPSVHDIQIVNECIDVMQISALEKRDYNTLSGGEAQKVQMSRVLAQIGDLNEEKKILFLDEPVSHLDVKYQQQLLSTAKNLCNKEVTVIAVLHDLNLALRFADRILLMKEGSLRYTLEEPKEISASMINEIFDVNCAVEKLGDRTIVVF